MGVTSDKISKAVVETHRFLERVAKLKQRAKAEGGYSTFMGCKETGDVKRASMDLSRALIELRK